MEKKKVGAGFGVLILNKQNQVLLGKRHDDPEKADSELSGEGTWTMPGGKMEFGETIELGATREVMEETGIKINKVKIIGVNNDKNQNAHFITIALKAEEFEGEPQVLEPDEITEWKWFDLNNLPGKVFPPSLNVLQNHLQNKFYISE